MRYHRAHESTNLFCKGPDSKYIWLCGPCVSVKTTQLCHCGVKAAVDDTSTNDCGCVSIILYLQEQVVAKFDLQAIVASPDIAGKWPVLSYVLHLGLLASNSSPSHCDTAFSTCVSGDACVPTRSHTPASGAS